MSRVGVHVRLGEDKKHALRSPDSLKGPKDFAEALKIHAFSDSGSGIDGIIFTSDSGAAYGEFEREFQRLVSPSDVARANRQQSGNVTTISFIPFAWFNRTVTTTTASSGSRPRRDTGLALIAQSFLLAECDLFLGSFSSNVATSVAHLMGAMRFGNSLEVPARDVGGSPLPSCNTLSEAPLKPMGV